MIQWSNALVDPLAEADVQWTSSVQWRLGRYTRLQCGSRDRGQTNDGLPADPAWNVWHDIHDYTSSIVSSEEKMQKKAKSYIIITRATIYHVQ